MDDLDAASSARSAARSPHALLAASRARAAAGGRSYCTPDDVKALALSVLSPRTIPSPGVPGSEHGAAAPAPGLVREILRSVPVAEAV